MTSIARVYQWDQLFEGMVAQFPFSVSAEDMVAFGRLSGDTSRIHIDSNFAQVNGFSHTVVYGALITAKLSCLVGMYLPGDLGLATEWRVSFHNPLYINRQATMLGEITHVSQSTRTVKLKFSVVSNEQIIASGTAGSKILLA